ncbi:allantoinase-like [Camellia sinensis]|uniref:allantoinase-like n=1 Tax=Camellia sinensis TaxID=4442 RepID=UPI0010366CB7|nr:allantoinase-like [Camellia sinensis]XP_028085955.1 allantoinase-like [Camellia sinensis]XP_028085956.1 allantoinase-like [Camellia sinensis]XP_028085957.1 allantoinase-like [Camellia sinensis]XP_028085958.1 allantoinase-like [Camellia sinensis]XP_028085959.1 allantoinase-like [Camellia sinensis]XP_028085960.1 allantoinase-like [Camellia sinensis]XP_028085961.1 allantoinase-like [Camellia sinensis]
MVVGTHSIHITDSDAVSTEWEVESDDKSEGESECGLTTLVDMPLNSFPSTVSKETFELKIKAAAKRIYVDVDWQWWKTVRAASEDLILCFWKYFDIGF